MSLYEHTLAVTQNNFLAHLNLGVVYSNLGRYQDEADTYRKVTRIKPDYAKGNLALGIASFSLNRNQEAIDAFKQAILVKPDYAQAHFKLGALYLISGNKSSALDESRILKDLYQSWQRTCQSSEKYSNWPIASLSTLKS